MELKPKMTVRVLEEWHRGLKAEAALRGITVSWLVRIAVDEWLANHPREQAVAKAEK